MHKVKKEYLYLHGLLLLYSLSGVCSKAAGEFVFLSGEFVVCYGIVLAILIFYAIAWQQLLKRLPLVTAYANKAVTVIWGMLFGNILFQETITGKHLLGALIMIAGILLVVCADESDVLL